MMSETNAVYIAWQAPDTHSWHVVGRLFQTNNSYVFNYTEGARSSDKFIPFSGMDILETTYFSTDLFPLFKNRMLSSKRPEYPHFIEWLGLTGEESAIDVLGRSGGLRVTDNLQVFKRIRFDQDGMFQHYIFAHGVGYLSDSARRRIERLQKGDALYLCLDVQNDFDPKAVILRAENPAEIVGYCPRYVTSSLRRILKSKNSSLHVSVAAHSKEAPANYRLMCVLEGRVPDELKEEMMMEREYMPISNHKWTMQIG